MIQMLKTLKTRGGIFNLTSAEILKEWGKTLWISHLLIALQEHFRGVAFNRKTGKNVSKNAVQWVNALQWMDKER